MKVSVIIPCHNAGSFIQDALRSVAAQTLPAHEIIVIDDSSADDSIAKVRSCGANAKLLQVNYRNAAATRNAGIAEASGKWLAFLDADNQWMPDHLASAQRQLERGRDVAYMAHRAITNPRTGALDVPPPPIAAEASGLADREFVQWLVRHQYGFGTTGFVLDAGAVRAVNGFDETQVRRHDWELFARVIKGRTWSFDPAPHWIKRPPREGDISSDECACKYYMLRGLIKTCALYESRALDRFTRGAARHAISAAIRSDDNAGIRRAYDLGALWLTPFDRVVFAVAMRFAFARALLRLRAENARATRAASGTQAG